MWLLQLTSKLDNQVINLIIQSQFRQGLKLFSLRIYKTEPVRNVRNQQYWRRSTLYSKNKLYISLLHFIYRMFCSSCCQRHISQGRILTGAGYHAGSISYINIQCISYLVMFIQNRCYRILSHPGRSHFMNTLTDRIIFIPGGNIFNTCSFKHRYQFFNNIFPHVQFILF